MKIATFTTTDIIAELENDNSIILKEIESLRVKANAGVISGDEFLEAFFDLKSQLK
tara:strand:+ start:222 stop:389 length:168 start_codon:yes stop_codon:yes gene_type:complete